MKIFRAGNYAPSTADLAFKVIRRPEVLEAFPMTNETYYSIFTWPEWLQQSEGIRYEGRKLFIWQREVVIGDWFVILRGTGMVVAMSDRDFVDNYVLLSGFMAACRRKGTP